MARRLNEGLIRDKANGTGPYQLDHWTPGAEIVLTGNPNYRQGAPKIDRVEIKPIGNFEQRLQFLLARDADLIETTSAEEQARLDKLVREKCDASGQCDVIDFNGSLREYVGLPSIARRNVFFNFALPKGNSYAGSGQLDGQGVPLNFFADVHVRRALNACFDRRCVHHGYVSAVNAAAICRRDHAARSAGLRESPVANFDRRNARKNSRQPNSRTRTSSRCGMWALR